MQYEEKSITIGQNKIVVRAFLDVQTPFMELRLGSSAFGAANVTTLLRLRDAHRLAAAITELLQSAPPEEPELPL